LEACIKAGDYGASVNIRINGVEESEADYADIPSKNKDQISLEFDRSSRN
jgi:hypothetical protein